MGGARTWAAAAVVVVAAVVATVAPAAAAAGPAVALGTTLTGARVPGGDPVALGAARIEVQDGSLCASLALSASTLPAEVRLVGPGGTAVDLPPVGEDGRSSGCADGVPQGVLDGLVEVPTAWAVEVPGAARGGLQRTSAEGTLLGARLRGLAGDGAATVAANPARGRICSEVPGGGALRRDGGTEVVELPERGCVRGLAPGLVRAVATTPGRFVVEAGDRRGRLAPAASFAGPALPRFAAGPCPEAVPVDPRFSCGTLTVAEDRTDPGGAVVELPVAVLRTDSPTPQPDPVVYFEGGPGYGGLGAAGLFQGGGFGGDRDVILFDQRGTGGARPSLNCPEVDEATWSVFATTDAPAVENERILRAYDACRTRLVAEDVDLDTYDTGVAADDAEDLRVALGIRRWNLFGVSYGTTLALQTARAHPDAVRSLTVDSVYPPSVSNAASALVAAADRGFATLYSGCAADAACAAAYPDLEQAVADVVARYDAAPHPTSVTDPASGVERPVRITGRDVLYGLFQAMYDTSLVPAIPSFVTGLRAGDTAIIDLFADVALPSLIESAEGMAASVECSDRAAFPDDLAATLAERPEWSSLVGGFWDCARWDVEPAGAGFNEPVTVDVPALVLAGEYDPITPPEDGRVVAEALPRSTFVELPAVGHGAVFSSPCAAAVFGSFLASPEGPDTGCVAQVDPPAWAVPTPPATLPA